MPGGLAEALPDSGAIARLAALPGVSTAAGVAEAADEGHAAGRVLPVLPPLRELLPAGGLRRGSTVAVHGSTSLLLALLSEASSAGSWTAVVGMPDLGIAAAAELGVEVSRLALVPRPGADFASVVAALLDGFDLVAVAVPRRADLGRIGRRLAARTRHRGAVLLSFGSWPGADVELRCVPGAWSGLDNGHGYLRQRSVEVHRAGRGAAGRFVGTGLLLPAQGGAITSGAATQAPVSGTAVPFRWERSAG
jgi:hypothetical protein